MYSPPMNFPLAERKVSLVRPRIVILGAGFGGLNAALALKRADADITIVDRHNYHLFQPLLYQVATAGLSPNQIATPIRQILSRQKNISVLMDSVVDVDINRSEVIATSQRIGFDYLIVATGARHAYFGHDEWESVAPGLKKIDEATDIRKHLLLAFEKAETMANGGNRQRLLTFVVVGGGLMDPEATTTAFRERYLNIVRSTAREYLWPFQRDVISIVPAALGDLSQAIGAALSALYKARS